MFTTNVTKSGASTSPGVIEGEFVTSGYFGGLPGDPDGGSTRVVTQNRAGPTFWVGKQANGSKFEAYWDKVGAVGHYDYGSLTMARTLGSDPNQVLVNGRKVLVGWIGGGSVASQSLGRDLSLSSEYELLQQFIPELQMLRQPASVETQQFVGSVPTGSKAITHSTGSLRVEIVATFSWTGSNPTAPFGVSILDGAANLTIDCKGTNPSAPNGCMVGTGRAVGPLMPLSTKTVALHAIVDHQIVETIFNNRTAMVTYTTPASATATAVELFGVTSGIKGTITTWALDAANNAGPQP
jgi:sucrose-6-phosphate hydrolase SacC (GH32 family)